MMRHLTLPILFLILATAVGCGEPNDTPDGAVNHLVASLRENDIATLLRTSATAEQWEQLEAGWQQAREEKHSDREAREFEETMKKLTSRDAVDVLHAELQPQLAMASQQWSMMVGMLPMLASSAGPLGVAGLDQVAAGLATKLRGVDIGDQQKLREALEVVTRCARKLDLETLDDMRKLDLDDMLDKGGLMLGATKDVLTVYGLDFDAVLDSARVSVLSEVDGRARVQVAYDLFGAAQQTEFDLVEQDGRWFPPTP